MGGGLGGAPLADGARLVEIDDPEVIVSAIEPRPDRRAVLRVYNASARPRTVALRWNGFGARSLEPTDLVERTVRNGSVSTEKSGATVSLRPWEIATLRVS